MDFGDPVEEIKSLTALAMIIRIPRNIHFYKPLLVAFYSANYYCSSRHVWVEMGNISGPLKADIFESNLK